MVDDDFNFQYDTSVSQSFHHLLAAVYRLGYDVRCFGSRYLETDFLRYASGVFSDSYQIIEERVRIEERIFLCNVLVAELPMIVFCPMLNFARSVRFL